jgi:hypothetical protein
MMVVVVDAAAAAAAAGSKKEFICVLLKLRQIRLLGLLLSLSSISRNKQNAIP